MIDLNQQRKDYLKARGKIVLKACPGSGKTTIISYKLHTLLEGDYNEKKDGGIACLSFTNVAKDEINQKYIEFSKKGLIYPNMVSTIDSFINTYITLPFYYLLKNGEYQRPTILDENQHLNEFWINDLWVYDQVKKKRVPKHQNKEGKYLINTYPPSDIQKDINGVYTFKGNMPKSEKVDLNIFNDYAGTIKKWQFKHNVLTNYDSTKFALNILNGFPQVCQGLARRFGYIIVDEAQDTSEIQHAIFEKLIENGLKNIELVGDPYQSLYSWRDAKPKVFMDKYFDSNWLGLNLSDNWRSSQKIINIYSRLRKSTDEIISAKVKSEIEHPIYILTFKAGMEFQALEKYNKLCLCYKHNQVVTRGVDLSEKLSGVLENNNNFWKNDLSSKIIDSIMYLGNGNIKYAIDTFRWGILNLVYSNEKLNYKEKREKLKELKNDYHLNAELNQLLVEFSDFELTLAEWTLKTAARLTIFFSLVKPLDFELKRGAFSPKHKKLMKDLFSDKKNKWDFPISTIHKVKGMTLDTILLFLHKTRSSISLADIVKPVDELTEKQTMIYVAMSRPRHLLAIAVEETVDINDVFKALGNDVVIM